MYFDGHNMSNKELLLIHELSVTFPPSPRVSVRVQKSRVKEKGLLIFSTEAFTHLYWWERKSESDIASKYVHRESKLMFTLNSDKNQRLNSLWLSIKSIKRESKLVLLSFSVTGSSKVWDLKL